MRLVQVEQGRDYLTYVAKALSSLLKGCHGVEFAAQLITLHLPEFEEQSSLLGGALGLSDFSLERLGSSAPVAISHTLTSKHSGCFEL